MLNELLEQYWDAAYAEGKEGRDHDTEDGIAQQTLSAIHAEVERLVEAERELCASAVEAEALECPTDSAGDEAYDNAIRHAAAAIRMRSKRLGNAPRFSAVAVDRRVRPLAQRTGENDGPVQSDV